MFTNCYFSSRIFFNTIFTCSTWSFLRRSTISEQPFGCKVLTSLFIAFFHYSLPSPLSASLTEGLFSVNARSIAIILKQLDYLRVRVDIRSGFCTVSCRAPSSWSISCELLSIMSLLVPLFASPSTAASNEMTFSYAPFVTFAEYLWRTVTDRLLFYRFLKENWHSSRDKCLVVAHRREPDKYTRCSPCSSPK